MALLAQGFDPSGYTPSYAVANAANQELFNRQSAAQQEVQGAITDYQKEQKALAQKDKEMAAKIKGTISLLDNAKALYPDFAERIDATKLQLVDPSLSSLDKLGIAGNVEGSLNMMVTKGSDAMKNKLLEAQIGNYETQSRTAGRTPMRGVVNGKVVEGFGDVVNGKFTPFETGQQDQFGSTTTTGQNLGAPPMDIPITTGQNVPENEATIINNGKQVVWKGVTYDVDSGVLGPKDQSAAISAAQNMNIPSTVTGRDANAIAQTSQMIGPSSSRISSGFLAQAGYPSGNQSQVVSQPAPVPQVQAAQSQAQQTQVSAQPVGQSSRMVGPAPKEFAPESPEAQESRKLRDAQARAEIALTNQKLAEAKGTQEQKTQAVQEAKMANDRAKREALTIVKSATSLTNEILKNIPEDNTASTVWRALGPEVLARNQKKLSNALKPIEAQVMLRTLNSLREASTTGGSGLGPLSDKEGALLMSSIASLDAYADPTDIRRSLKAINDHFINAEFGDREERIQLVKENKMTIPKFNEIESKYSINKPLKLPDIPLTNRTPAQEEALNKHLQSR
jgi:hypothetical protein